MHHGDELSDGVLKVKRGVKSDFNSLGGTVAWVVVGGEGGENKKGGGLLGMSDGLKLGFDRI